MNTALRRWGLYYCLTSFLASKDEKLPPTPANTGVIVSAAATAKAATTSRRESKGPTSNFQQQIRRLSWSLFCPSLPRVDHRHPRRDERRGVARGDDEVARCGDGRDLCIANGKRVPRPARAAHQVCIGFRGNFVECQNVSIFFYWYF